MTETNIPMSHLLKVLNQFQLQGSVAHLQPFGTGHIHDTFRVQNTYPALPDYLLQRINHRVFKQIPALMENIRVVTQHLRQKLTTIPGHDPEKEVLTLISTRQNQDYYQDEAGNYWRVYIFLPHTRTYDRVETGQQAYEGGKAFGRFQTLLTDLDAAQLHETIPDFHNITHRLRQLQDACQCNAVGRVPEVVPELAFVEERKNSMPGILRLGQQGKIPLRVTHNDTKFNNVLLNLQDEAQCVIDLDTVMPGYVAYDYGDAIRTTISTATEDEKDLSRITINLDLFTGFTKGFLAETAGFLTASELESLLPGVLLLPYMQGVRFLTDYLAGDQYFKIHFPAHNLQRARAQFRLVQVLEQQQGQLQGIIQEILATSLS